MTCAYVHIISTINHYITIHPPELLYDPDQHTTIPEVLQYEKWLPQWITHLRDAPSVLAIPPSASVIHTPMNSKCWQEYLSSHPNQALV